jgi:hypothetical protein
MKSLALLVAALIGQSACRAQAGVGEVISLPDYAVWCTNVSLSRDVNDAQYYNQLANSVRTIDKTLGAGASTGTPFVARSANRPADANTPNSKDQLVVTVCTAVPLSAAVPPNTDVFREIRAGEAVFAAACDKTDGAKCVSDARTALATLVGPTLAPAVATLFSRSVLTKAKPQNADEMRQLLTATDLRPVTLPPSITGTGDQTVAAALTKPIEQQTARPLLTAKPSWFTIIGRPEDKWVIVAITLSPDMATALNPAPH